MIHMNNPFTFSVYLDLAVALAVGFNIGAGILILGKVLTSSASFNALNASIPGIRSK